jgi:hypothetical protein
VLVPVHDAQPEREPDRIGRRLCRIEDREVLVFTDELLEGAPPDHVIGDELLLDRIGDRFSRASGEQEQG